MNKFFTILFLTLSAIQSFGQDNTKITYTEEIDTLTKQRFIDRYVNIFMTKVPTRQMFSIGFSTYYHPLKREISNYYDLHNSFIKATYEYKFMPTLSVGISGYLPYNSFNFPVYNSLLEGNLRWFVNMKKRVNSGKSASNFSGNYVSINYAVTNYKPVTGIKFGFLHRFLNSGFLDFALSLQKRGNYSGNEFKNEWSLSSQATFGIAFGDWKKSATPPLCDILLCDNQIFQQWKIRLPDITIASRFSKIGVGIAYERKIGSSPFSVNVQYDLGLYKKRTFSNNVALQPRFYLTAKHDRLTGRATNGLSGIYTGVNLQYEYVDQYGSFKIGPLIGFQQRLFSHAYIDFNASYNLEKSLYDSVQDSRLTLNANLGVGFAF